MKKIVSILLLLCILLTLCSCSSSLAAETAGKTEETKDKIATGEKGTEEKEREEVTIPQGFSVGYAKGEVNPAVGTGLGGYGTQNDRVSGRIIDDLYLTCTAISDGENTVLIFSGDSIHVAGSTAAKVGSIAEKNFGIPAGNIIINATHTHAGPAIPNSNAPGIASYLKKYYAVAEEMIYQALLDLENATVYAGSTVAEGMNYVRRYVNIQTGEYAGKNLPDGLDPAVYGHETVADPEMQILRFDRATKKDVILCNWQCHPTTTGSSTGSTVSADFIAYFRSAVEEAGHLFSYHQGAGGNLVAGSRIAGNQSNSDYIKYGKDLAAIALGALEKLPQVESGKVQAKKYTFTGTHSEEYRKKNKIEATTETFSLSVLSIGDVAFATAPCELHDTLGVEIKTKSPFKLTFVCGYTNGTVGYMPASFAFANGGYEVESTHFVQGTGEAIVADLLGNLNEIYTTK